MTGIYVIKSTKHFYIGLSSNLDNRFRDHISKLKQNIHPNNKLQNVYNKGYTLEFEIIQECSIDDLDRLEIFWIDLYQILHPELKILNLKSGGNRPTYSYEAKEKMSKSKCQREYDWKQRYIVYKIDNDEILYIGTLLDISKFIKIDIQHLTICNKMWSSILNCYFSIIEELDEDILNSYYGENYF